ncbi:hypothetical protein B9T33_16295 [Acinetobacter sp. ANC 5054]|uniref:MobA/MobL family protein n=1 Tax=Acinetobacter sp. ANC 5054 TaxID=1977877 RepID=UPI000A33D161|nr:MobA/MobL family protein [Acinetobacter sp. ANC 5054]OTG75647.1 hypothetical protein B9T33_16295 [Acinetobacter sp. ANC 5054]
MYYYNQRHNVKQKKSSTPVGKNKTKPKRNSTSKNGFHYITRTAHHSELKDGESVEFVKSGNMPTWAEKNPKVFWHSADRYEIERGRTSQVMTVALPKELSSWQRQELVENFIDEFANKHQFPFTCAVHIHKSAITGEDQPHLHFMYSERTLADGLERPPEQFFKQYRPKNPTKGGAQKLTADVLGLGREQINYHRQIAENLINESLLKYAPTKIVKVKGRKPGEPELEILVPNVASCLSNKDYNAKHGTNLRDVEQIPRYKLYSSDPDVIKEVQAKKEMIITTRDWNNFELYHQQYYAAFEKIKEAEKLKQQEIKSQAQQQIIDPVAVYNLAVRLSNTAYIQHDKLNEIIYLSDKQLSSSTDIITLIERKASLLNDVAIKDTRKEVSTLVYEIYKCDVAMIQENSRGRSLTYDEIRMLERLNERISQFENMYASNPHKQFKSENTRNHDDLNNTPEP